MSEAVPESSLSRSNSVSLDPSKSSSRSQATEDSSMDIDAPRAMSSAGENLVRSDIGSPDRQRELGFAVDLNHGTGMPGYVGKMSDVSWLHRVCEYLVAVPPLSEPDLGLAELDAPTTSLSYFTDDHNLLAIDGKSDLQRRRRFQIGLQYRDGKEVTQTPQHKASGSSLSWANPVPGNLVAIFISHLRVVPSHEARSPSFPPSCYSRVLDTRSQALSFTR